MGEYDDYPHIVIERERGGLGLFVWGALLGAAAALLLTPRTGAETQAELRDRARRLRDAAEGRVNDARDTVTGAVERTRSEVTGRINTVRGAIETRADQARQAVEVGRRAALDARAELERRVSDAKAAYRAGTDGLQPAAAPPVVEAEVIIVETSVEGSGSDGLL
ncbi:MAG: YtxH domain-containing protein [Gemmatimonadetes bacterium]|nr:YtxH domain-containing protein [Gemmatimonadota bacterium]